MSAEEDDTPVTLPGKRPTTSNGANGVPEAVPFENTGEVANTLYSAVADMPGTAEEFLNGLAKKLVEHGGGGGGDGGGERAKHDKKQNSIFLILMLLVGPGGAVGAHYALKGQADSNSQEVVQVKEAVKAMAPAIEENQEQIRLIKVDVSGINSTMKSVGEQQTQISKGIESLKQENVNRLQRELDQANRELRRRRNSDDD